MKPYIHRVHYHETDKMGITHHSNYIKWMEEARIDYLDQLGCGYDKLEADGIFSPVLTVECQYRKSTTFGDQICIRAYVEAFRGVTLVIAYEMTDENGETVCTGRTSHCFTDSAARPIILKKHFPAFDAALKAQIPAAE